MIGQTISRYKILAELGKGGMGIVYRAYDSGFGREVAMKVLPSHFLHEAELRQRLEREAKMIASLEHPAIVPVYDFGEYNGQPFLVMRLMSSGSLKARLKHGALPFTEMARMMSHLAPALDQAHAQGIIHRDLKPSNILFDQHNLPYIADFGIAKQILVTSNLTASGSILGSPKYMSPEQARGHSNLSGQSDIYALGVILFHMLTGDVPYKADTPVATALCHVTQPVPPLNRPDLAPTWQSIINRAMAKSPQARYPTAAALAAHVAAAVQEQQKVQSHPSGGAAPPAVDPTVIVSRPGPRLNRAGYPTPSPPQGPQPPRRNVIVSGPGQPPNQAGYPTPQPPLKPQPPRQEWAKMAGMMGIGGLLALVVCLCLSTFVFFLTSWPPSTTSWKGPLNQEPTTSLLLEEDFSDRLGGWNFNSNEDAIRTIENGQYHITVIKENLISFGGPAKQFSDFTLQVESTQIDGPSDNFYGVILRWVDNDNYYLFGLSGEGSYQFGKFENNEPISLVNWTQSSAINTGQATNLIKVECKGDTFTFFVNGERLESYRDSSFASGDIGLFAGRFEAAGDVHISFDNVKVWAIE